MKAARNTFATMCAGVALLALFGIASAQDAEPVTVSITDESFSPVRISVPVGTTVTWVNNGARKHWPASDFHPTHDLYPSEGDGGCIGSNFDACRGLEPGESYSFTFTKSGTWGVHDHLFPGLTMRVEVTGEDHGPQGEMGVSEDQSSFIESIAGFFRSLWEGLLGIFRAAGEKLGLQSPPEPEIFLGLDAAEQQGIIRNMSKDNPQKAWDFLKSSFIVNGEVRGDAHELAHIVGNVAYRERGFDGITVCDSTFAFGCFHGVTEEMLVTEGDSVIGKIEGRCIALFPPDVTQDYTGCIHGTGHGLLTWEALDINRALARCDTFSQQYRSYCYDGVFMEYAFAMPNQQIDENNPWELCLQLPQEYHFNCARYRGPTFLAEFEFDFARAARACLATQSTILSNTCIESMGYQIAQITKSDERKARELCSLLPEAGSRNLCLAAVATELHFQKYQGWEQVVASLCGSLPEPVASRCPNS